MINLGCYDGVQSQHSWLTDHRVYEGNLIIATVCTTAVLGTLLVFTHRIADVFRHRLAW